MLNRIDPPARRQRVGFMNRTMAKYQLRKRFEEVLAMRMCLKSVRRILVKRQSPEGEAIDLKIPIKVQRNAAAVPNLTSLLLPAPKPTRTTANWSHINIRLTSFIFNRFHWSQVRANVAGKKKRKSRKERKLKTSHIELISFDSAQYLTRNGDCWVFVFFLKKGISAQVVSAH